MPRYDVPKAAPQPLRLVQELVNSVDLENDVEWLATPDELRTWLVDRELIPPRSAVRPADVRTAHRLRTAFRALLIANNEHTTPPEDALEIVNDAAERARLMPLLNGGAKLVPRADGVGAAFGKLVAVAFDAIQDGSWQRLKACRQCHWAFYDYSRNRAASWCSMAICGNRLKTRAYRARQRT
jgi:predicted RNA-binding Zn ribbon-like protein